MAQKSRELRALGKDIISLALGEPDFDTPDLIKEAAKRGIDENYSKYMPVPGYLDLRQAICHKFKRDNGLEFSPEQIVVSTGAKQSVANVVLSLINPGDEVVLPSPYWVTYEEIVKLANGTPVNLKANLANDFKITPDQLKAAVTPKTKLVIFSSPCNPTGSVYSLPELRGLAEVIAQSPHVHVVADEIYEHINFVGRHSSLASIPEIAGRVITVNGVSKAFAMTGWRIGYLAAALPIAKACVKMQGQVTSGASSIAQRAAKAALEADPGIARDMRETFEKRRNFVLKELGDIQGIEINEPEGAFYVFPDITALFGKRHSSWGEVKNSDDFCMYLLEVGLVATVTGNAFGAPGHFRLSYAAADEELRTAMQRIKQAVSQLQ